MIIFFRFRSADGLKRKRVRKPRTRVSSRDERAYYDTYSSGRYVIVSEYECTFAEWNIIIMILCNARADVPPKRKQTYAGKKKIYELLGIIINNAIPITYDDPCRTV